MSTTIDAAIIKALVEHVGGDSSNIGNGVIGGKTYTAGDAIDLSNDKISVKYDTNTMELKNGALASKGGAIYTAGKGISIGEDNVLNVNYDTTFFKSSDGVLTTKRYTITNYNASMKDSQYFAINDTSNQIVFQNLAREDIIGYALILKHTSNGSRTCICVDDGGQYIRFWDVNSKNIICLKRNNNDIIFPRSAVTNGYQPPYSYGGSSYWSIPINNMISTDATIYRMLFKILELLDVDFTEFKDA